MTTNGTSNASEVIARIRERVRARHASESDQRTPQVNALPRVRTYNLHELHINLAACNALHNAVGSLNPRRPGLHNQAIQWFKKLMRRSLSWYTRPLHEFHAAVTRTLNETTQALEQLRAEVTQLQRPLDAVKRDVLKSVDTGTGAKAQAGLYFNEPVMVDYDDEGRAYWAATSERIVERSWLFRQLAALPLSTRILDLGSSESLISFELASSGLQVVGVDVRDYPLHHPNLQFMKADICKTGLESSSFDAAVALSTLEHIGLGFYGDSRDDLAPTFAMNEIFRLLRPGAHLFLTVPFGQSAVTPQHRIFDSDSLKALLGEFEIKKMEFGRRVDAKTWIYPVSEPDASQQRHDPATLAPGAVALAVCRKPEAK